MIAHDIPSYWLVCSPSVASRLTETTQHPASVSGQKGNMPAASASDVSRNWSKICSDAAKWMYCDGPSTCNMGLWRLWGQWLGLENRESPRVPANKAYFEGLLPIINPI